jgi:hypothetical protein
MPFGRRGEICASGAPNDFSRSSETPNTPTHYSQEPTLYPRSGHKLLGQSQKSPLNSLLTH